MRKMAFIVLGSLGMAFFSPTPLRSHICDNVFRQEDKLIVKPEIYNLIIKGETAFKVYLQNNMDRAIAEISLVPESPDFDFLVTPDKMSIPRGQKVYFEVIITPKLKTRTGNYSINFRLVGGGREFKRFGLDAIAEERTKTGRGEVAASILQVKKTGASPEIDGVINDQAWKNAAVASNFCEMGRGKAEFQTLAMLTFDRKNLYFGFYCYDDKPRELSSSDRIEIKISRDPSGYPYYLFILPATGSSYYKKFLSEKKSIPCNVSGANYNVTSDNESWSGEFKLPFSGMETSVPTQKEKWYIRIERHKLTGFPEKSYWAADSSGYNIEKGFGEFLIIP